MKTKTKVMLLGLVCLLMLVGLLPLAIYAATTIQSTEIMLNHPVHLASPDNFLIVYGGKCRVDTSINSNGYKDGIRWKDCSTGTFMDETRCFAGGSEYELSVCLLANTGYAFSSNTVININMEKASITSYDMNHIVATISFTADKLYIHTINITDVETPEADNTPDTTLTQAEYSYSIKSVTWTDLTGDAVILNTTPFRAGHKYKLSFEAEAISGYQYTGAPSVYVNGKSTIVKAYTSSTVRIEVEFPEVVEKTPAHVHTVSPWRTTGAYHYTVCTTCGEFLSQEDHKGGVATCAEKGKCTVCGYEYIDTTENHTPDVSQWIARGEMYHYHKCTVCGAHCDTSDHVPGPTGTPDTDVVCKDCGYIITPAKGHEHMLTKVESKPATCTAPGNVEYYTCSGCSAIFADANGTTKITDTVIAPLGHKISEGWNHDEANHWRVCTVCNEALTETKMIHTSENGKCIDCSRTLAEETKLADTPSENEDSAALPWWAILLIAFGAVDIGLVAGIVIAKSKNKG